MKTTSIIGFKKRELIDTPPDITATEDNWDKVESELYTTINQSSIPTKNDGKLSDMVSWFANRIKTITGKTNWYDNPSKNLEDLNNHIINHPKDSTKADKTYVDSELLKKYDEAKGVALNNKMLGRTLTVSEINNINLPVGFYSASKEVINSATNGLLNLGCNIIITDLYGSGLPVQYLTPVTSEIGLYIRQYDGSKWNCIRLATGNEIDVFSNDRGYVNPNLYPPEKNPDFNNFIDSGKYSMTGAINAPLPSGYNGWYNLEVIKTTDNYVSQIASTIHDDTNKQRLFHKTKNFKGWSEWKEIATTEKIEILNSDLTNGWVAYGGGLESPSYSRVGNRVFCSGLIKDGTVSSGTLLFNLPVGFRPSGTVICGALSNNTLARIDVKINGDVVINTGVSYNYINLNGISFNIN